MSRKSRIARAFGIERRLPTPFGMHWATDVNALASPILTVFDVGANVGQFALEASRRFPASVIHAFEPVPETFERLRRNVARRPNIIPVRCAVSDRQGAAEMTAVGVSEMNTLAPTRSSATTVTVPLTTVDEYVASTNVNTIDLLKIDTEGHESQVLAGANQALARGAIQLVLAECDFLDRPEAPHGEFSDLFETMSAHGYRVVTFYCHGIDGDGWVWGDVLFMLPRAMPGMLGPRSARPPFRLARTPR